MQGIAIDGFEQKGFDTVRFDYTEKLSQFNKMFDSKLLSEKGIFGLTEINKGNGLTESFWRNPDGFIVKQYLKDGKVYQQRSQLDKYTWQNVYFDDNGTSYVKEIIGKSNDGLKYKGLELTPDIKVEKGNFTAVIDELGRPVMNKVTDIKKSARQTLSNKFRDASYKVGDEQGHVIADSVGGPASKENIVAQSFDTNRKKMAQVEIKVRDLKKAHPDSKIDYEVKVNYDGNSKRPSSFEPKITIDGKEFKGLESEYKKVYNESGLTTGDKVVTTAKEHLNKVSTKVTHKVIPTAKAFHKAGLDEGMEAVLITCAVSTVDNVSQYMDGDITAEEMVIDIAKDTGTAGAVGYGTGFVTKVVATSMQSSTNTMLQSLGQLGVPAAVVSFGVESYDSVMDFAQGEIDGMELAYDLGENAASVAGGAAGAALAGAAIGSVIPVGGTAVGFVVGGGVSLVGGMVGTAVATGAYQSAIEMGTAGAEVLADKAQEVANGTIEIAKECMPEHVNDVRNALNTFLSQNNMPFSV